MGVPHTQMINDMMINAGPFLVYHRYFMQSYITVYVVEPYLRPPEPPGFGIAQIHHSGQTWPQHLQQRSFGQLAPSRRRYLVPKLVPRLPGSEWLDKVYKNGGWKFTMHAIGFKS